jgi:hypothetical protein
MRRRLPRPPPERPHETLLILKSRRQVIRAVAVGGLVGQCLPNTLHQQAVASVLQHRQRQGELQHLAQRYLVVTHRQRQIALSKINSCIRLLEKGWSWKKYRIGILVTGCLKRCARQRLRPVVNAGLVPMVRP